MWGQLALRSAYRSAVRELPDERTIEHGHHCNEHGANDDPCPGFGFAVRLVCVHMDHRSRNAVEMAAPGMQPQRGRGGKDPCPDSAARAGQFLPGGSMLERPEPRGV